MKERNTIDSKSVDNLIDSAKTQAPATRAMQREMVRCGIGRG